MAGERTVLVVDDDPDILEVVGDFLAAAGVRPLTAADAAQARATLARESVDLALVDISLGGKSGFDLCRELRLASDLPLILLTARDSDNDKVRGLGLGADDYIVKSASLAEVLARINAVLRRGRQPVKKDGILDFGRLRLDPRSHQAWAAGDLLALTAKEFALLRFLADHPRRVFTHDELFEAVWGSKYGDRHAVAVYVDRLRDKIELNPSDPDLIVTVRGFGYRFEGRSE